MSTGVLVSIQGLMAYSTAKWVGGVMAYRRTRAVRTVVGSEWVAIAAGKASEIVMNRWY
ncbi:hypothetical protein MCNF_38280 [Mycolicibacterium confluentis]|uniref:Uncharacterized protein n=1 Tax=Mycolicibacterium confluentis TaxID=28047 RepID=A0A7I7Y221_9MYCO|nr:hypothetical protein MCNF_38280 [Mycolicibacterium confluentis]